MLSKTSARLLVFSVKWTSFCGGMPYSWDDRRSKIRVSRRHWIKWGFWIIFLLIIGTLVWIRLITVLLHPGRSSVYDRAQLFMSTVVTIIPAVFAFNTWHHYLEFACFINSYIRFAQHFRNAYVKKLGRGWRNGCEGLLRTLSVAAVLFPIGPTIVYIQNPQDHRFVTSLLPQEAVHRYLYNAIVIVYGTIQFFWYWSIASTISFYLLASFIPIYLIKDLLTESMPGRYRYKTKPTVRRPPRLCQLYRSYQILNTMGNNALSQMTFPMKTTCIAFEVICNCILIKFWRTETPLKRFLLLTIPNSLFAAWLLSLYLSGRMLKETQNCIDSWKFLKLKLYRDAIVMKKFQKSCQPIRVKVGSFYVIRLIRVLLTFNTVFRHTFKVLISINKRM